MIMRWCNIEAQDGGDVRGPWFVSLVKGNCFKTQQRPSITGGKYSKAFHIVVKVDHEQQADEVLTYSGAIKVIQDTPKTCNMVKLAFLLPGGETILHSWVQNEDGKGFYPIVYGTQCAIFIGAYIHSQLAHDIVKAIWCKVPSFGPPIAYMVSKGESEKRSSGYSELLEASAKLTITLVGLQVLQGHNRLTSHQTCLLVLNGCLWTHHHMQSVFITTHCPTQNVRYPGCSPHKSTLYTLTIAFMLRIPLPSLALANMFGPHPLITHHASFDHPMFNEAIFSLPSVPVLTSDGFIYQHVCDLHGMHQTLTFPLVDRAAVPSCGPLLDALLQAYSYNTESRLLVARACRDSINMGDFVSRVVVHGLPVLEAKFMWSLYSSNPPTTQWADLHFMNKVKKLNNAWRNMSEDEKTTATKDLIKDLDEAKEMKSLSVQNVAISAFHDVRANMDSVIEELYAWTGLEVALIAVRSKGNQHTPPLIFATSDRIYDFFMQSLTLPLEEVSKRIKAYCLSGVPGLVEHHDAVLHEKQQHVADLILKKLCKITQLSLARVLYKGSIRSIMKLDILFNSWSNNLTFFCKLTHEEFE
ncbi:hypothetical protein BN946_scf185004.g3 [Trametes cinnabarina]|uniref:Uncharacterized protein n=1 Tax=Pycnoporus cinnabarinus TaxID=5643 RepID=A0A060SR02_PYCCI|nr:hypothetical protein BN946_scf185004.g3 [Trametes cinnabarina]